MNTTPRILAAAAGLAMPASLTCALPADAAVAHGPATGRTTAQLAVRTAPTVRTLARGSQATAVCRVEVQQAKGGTQGWYHLRDGGWMAVNSVLAKHATAACR